MVTIDQEQTINQEQTLVHNSTTRKFLTHRHKSRIAWGIAILLTVAGFQQVWLYKWVSDEKVAIWFPFLFLFRLSDDFLRVLISVIQFPLFATAYYVGLRRFRALPILCAIVLGYALCVIAAYALIKIK
jgi:hypothetical protein